MGIHHGHRDKCGFFVQDRELIFAALNSTYDYGKQFFFQTLKGPGSENYKHPAARE